MIGSFRSRSLLAGRILLIASLLGMCLPPLALADSARFNIAAQPLSAALNEFAKQANMAILFKSADVKDVQGNLVIGAIDKRKALNELLQNTGLEAVFSSESAATIRPIRARVTDSAAKPSVTVSARKGTKDPVDPFRRQKAEPGEPSAPADLQKEKQKEPLKEQEPVLSEVIVTGTHIRGVTPVSPVTVITRKDIERSGYATVGAVIRSLPENFGGGNNPQAVIESTPGVDNESPSGGTAPDLRGLGPGSTLTLVDGHRLAAEATTGAADISLIPLAVIDHIDVVKDGASAIYGSDAVAGVVNIVLRKNFNGAQTTILGAGTADGGATDRDINEMMGKTWNSGGVIFDYEYDNAAAVRASERDFAATAIPATTLLPQSDRNSFYLRANQQLGSRVSTSIESLFTHRITHAAFSYGGATADTQFNDIDVHQYLVSPAVDIALTSQWSLSIFGSFSEQRSIASVDYPVVAVTGLEGYEGFSRYVEATANGPVLSIPTGSVRAALGGGYRWERYTFETGSPGSLDKIIGARSIGYAYGEVEVPLIAASDEPWREGLELDLSARAERYSDFGDKAVPKIGLLYRPSEAIKVRGTWGKAFRAPPLFDLFAPENVGDFPYPNSASPTGVTAVLVTEGGSRSLQPETARTWTAGIDYDPPQINGLGITATVFNVDYSNRISYLPDYLAALTDPLEAPFVVRSPSEAYVESLINSAALFFNVSGVPFNPAAVYAVINDRPTNFASEKADGVDIGTKYHAAAGSGEIALFGNATYLDLRQRFAYLAPLATFSGKVFEPASVRARGGMTWSDDSWSFTGILNYTGPEVNTYQADATHIASWTTLDFQIGYRPETSRFARHFTASLSIENAFNRDPPYVKFDQIVPGVHYDPTNANVLGRVIRVSVSYLID